MISLSHWGMFEIPALAPSGINDMARYWMATGFPDYYDAKYLHG